MKWKFNNMVYLYEPYQRLFILR